MQVKTSIEDNIVWPQCRIGYRLVFVALTSSWKKARHISAVTSFTSLSFYLMPLIFCRSRERKSRFLFQRRWRWFWLLLFFFTRYYEEERKERKCLREKENVWERKEKDGACKAEREIIMLWSHGVMYCRENSWINFKLVQRLVLSSSIIYLRNCLCLVFHLHSRCPIFDFYLNNELIYLPLLIKLIRQNFRYFIDLSRAFYLINCPDLSTKLTCIVLWTCTWSSRFSINYLSDYQIIRIDNLLKLSDDRSSSRTFKSLDREFRSTSNVMQQTL